MKTLNQILRYLNKNDLSSLDQTIYHVSLDSRSQDKNGLFIAYQGINNNGNHYIDSAIQNGAIAVLTDNINIRQPKKSSTPILYTPNLKQKIAQLANWFYDYPSQKIQVTAVTGTNGKTSVCHLYAQLATLLGEKTATLGTIGNGIWPKLDTSTHTTPDPVSLQHIFQNLIQQDAQQVVIEASSHALEQGRLQALSIDTAIWTNLTHDHLDYHQTMEDYFQAKAKLFEFDTLRSMVVNIDDPYAKRLLDHLHNHTNANLLTYSLNSPKADLYFSESQATEKGYQTQVHYSGHVYSLYSPLMGQFNLYNLAATMLALIANGVDIGKIIPLIPHLKPAIGRMQQLNHQHFATVVIDYAHTPNALENALLTAKAHVKNIKNKLWCIFGCGGDRDTSKRAKMAAIAEHLADNVIITEDNNRTESFEQILKDIQSGLQLHKHTIIDDRTQAIYFAIDQAQADDLILLCGKGHERYMDKNGKKTNYNEEQIIQSYWSQKA